MARRGVRDDVWLALFRLHRVLRFLCFILCFTLTIIFAVALLVMSYFALLSPWLWSEWLKRVKEIERYFDDELLLKAVYIFRFSWETKTRSYRRRSRRSKSMTKPDSKSSSDMIILCNDMDSISFSLKSQGKDSFLSLLFCLLFRRLLVFCQRDHPYVCQNMTYPAVTSHVYALLLSSLPLKREPDYFQKE